MALLNVTLQIACRVKYAIPVYLKENLGLSPAFGQILDLIEAGQVLSLNSMRITEDTAADKNKIAAV